MLIVYSYFLLVSVFCFFVFLFSFQIWLSCTRRFANQYHQKLSHLTAKLHAEFNVWIELPAIVDLQASLQSPVSATVYAFAANDALNVIQKVSQCNFLSETIRVFKSPCFAHSPPVNKKFVSLLIDE